MENICVCCGKPIPEGMMVCFNCLTTHGLVTKNDKMRYTEIILDNAQHDIIIKNSLATIGQMLNTRSV